jgi:hypothetical protein
MTTDAGSGFDDQAAGQDAGTGFDNQAASRDAGDDGLEEESRHLGADDVGDSALEEPRDEADERQQAHDSVNDAF